MSIHEYNTGWCLKLWRSELWINRRCYQGQWWKRNEWGLDADGVFAIVTPWGMWYPWLGGRP